jgi:hypothetical protein
MLTFMAASVLCVFLYKVSRLLVYCQMLANYEMIDDSFFGTVLQIYMQKGKLLYQLVESQTINRPYSTPLFFGTEKSVHRILCFDTMFHFVSVVIVACLLLPE